MLRYEGGLVGTKGEERSHNNIFILWMCVHMSVIEGLLK